MAILAIPEYLRNQAIPLNRAAGESYDQGVQMSMQEAIRIAEQYGHVPARISSGSIPNVETNSNPMGVWAVPTERGWIPVEKLAGMSTPTENWSGGPPAAPAAPPSMVTGTAAPNPRPQGQYGPVQGPPNQQGNFGGPPYNPGPRYNFPQPSTTGPMVTGQAAQTGPPQQQAVRYDFPANATGQPGNVININVSPGPQPQGSYDQSGWHTPGDQFSMSPQQQARKEQIYASGSPPAPSISQPPPISNGDGFDKVPFSPSLSAQGSGGVGALPGLAQAGQQGTQMFRDWLTNAVGIPSGALPPMGQPQGAPRAPAGNFSGVPLSGPPVGPGAAPGGNFSGMNTPLSGPTGMMTPQAWRRMQPQSAQPTRLPTGFGNLAR